jgi:hypothetical protein
MAGLVGGGDTFLHGFHRGFRGGAVSVLGGLSGGELLRHAFEVLPGDIGGLLFFWHCRAQSIKGSWGKRLNSKRLPCLKVKCYDKFFRWAEAMGREYGSHRVQPLIEGAEISFQQTVLVY